MCQSSETMSYDPIVLSFHDTLLRQSDLDLLDGPHWLNDTVISFYFEYLEKIAFKDESSFLFVSPEVTQCLKISPQDELEVFLNPLKVKERQFAFFALNNCDVPETPGGTHWSLLAFSKPENAFFHLDSSSGCNHNQAYLLSCNLSKYLSIPENFTEIESLQQTNGYDCGIHVLCNVDQLADFCTKYNKITGVGLVDDLVVATKRIEVLNLIESMAD